MRRRSLILLGLAVLVVTGLSVYLAVRSLAQAAEETTDLKRYTAIL